MSTRLAAQPRSTRNDLLGVVVSTLFYAASMAVLVPALRIPAHVDHVTIENPHPWLVNIAVTDGDRDGWVGLGTVERDTEHTFQSVVDQGDQWIFRFAYAGHQVETVVSGARLDEDDWHVAVPNDLADRLRSSDVPETPP